MKLLNGTGFVLAQVGPVVMTPGQNFQTSSSQLGVQTPSSCTFQFKGKLKGSLVYINGTEVDVVPASR